MRQAAEYFLSAEPLKTKGGGEPHMSSFNKFLIIINYI